MTRDSTYIQMRKIPTLKYTFATFDHSQTDAIIPVKDRTGVIQFENLTSVFVRCQSQALSVCHRRYLVAASAAKGAEYRSKVLFPLTAPSGFVDFSSAGGVGVSADQFVGFDSPTGESDFHALLWTVAGAIDLNPTGISSSIANGTNGTQQVGSGFGNATGDNIHALLWTGTASSVVDLNPTGYSASLAYGTNGSQQVGRALFDGAIYHAILWNGTAASAVDLSPTFLGIDFQSLAWGTDGTQQVGYGSGSETNNNDHALLWNGTANSVVDLNPSKLSGVSNSFAFATNGTQQVGGYYGSGTGNNEHAILWTGTAASAVDLNPTDLNGISVSVAYGTNGSQQVGYGEGSGTASSGHALLWTGTAESAVDLGTILPATGVWADTFAYTIDSSGNVYGYAEGTLNNVSGDFAIEWSPVPEPTTASMLLLATAGISMCRKRNATTHPAKRATSKDAFYAG
jgi:hypothetical protein